MFGPQIPLKPLAMANRALSTMLQSGIAIGKAFDLASRKTGNARCRKALSEVSLAIRQGRDVSSAMREQEGAFPDLMCDMVDVAEQTGALPEILVALADHYEDNIRLRQRFYSAIAWPMFQLIMAILVVAAMIYLLGVIAESRGGEPLDVLGWGLTGSRGAVTWLTVTFGSLFGVLVARGIMLRTVLGRKWLDPILLRIPVVGNCLRAFAIARFSWAFTLTQQAGMPIEQSVEASFRATSNGAFLSASPYVSAAVRSGETLHNSLAESGLFPEDYLHMVDVAETSGTVPEMLERLSPQFEEQARRALSALTSALAWGIWTIVAIFIVFIIFRIFSWYLGLIDGALQGV